MNIYYKCMYASFTCVYKDTYITQMQNVKRIPERKEIEKGRRRRKREKCK